MTKKNIGGPAFPCEVGIAADGFTLQTGNEQWTQPGMMLRDYFAAKALQGMISMAGYTYDSRAVFAYNQADAMLRAREA